VVACLQDNIAGTARETPASLKSWQRAGASTMTNTTQPSLTITVGRTDFSYSVPDGKIKRKQCVEFKLGDRDSATVTFKDRSIFQAPDGSMPRSITLSSADNPIMMRITDNASFMSHEFTAPKVEALARGGDDGGGGGTMVGDVDVEPRLPNETRSRPRKQGQRATGKQRAPARR
jgi:hypothetical protein